MVFWHAIPYKKQNKTEPSPKQEGNPHDGLLSLDSYQPEEEMKYLLFLLECHLNPAVLQKHSTELF